MGYLVFLTGGVVGPMVSNHNVSYLIYFLLTLFLLSKVWYLIFANVDMENTTRNYPSGRAGCGLASLL